MAAEVSRTVGVQIIGRQHGIINQTGQIHLPYREHESVEAVAARAAQTLQQAKVRIFMADEAHATEAGPARNFLKVLQDAKTSGRKVIAYVDDGGKFDDAEVVNAAYGRVERVARQSVAIGPAVKEPVLPIKLTIVDLDNLGIPVASLFLRRGDAYTIGDLKKMAMESIRKKGLKQDMDAEITDKNDKTIADSARLKNLESFSLKLVLTARG